MDSKLVEHVNKRISNWSKSSKNNVQPKCHSDSRLCLLTSQSSESKFCLSSHTDRNSCFSQVSEDRDFSVAKSDSSDFTLSHMTSDQDDKDFSLQLSSHSASKRDSNSIISLLGMSDREKTRLQSIDNDPSMQQKSVDINCLPTYQTDIFTAPDRVYTSPSDDRDSSNASLWDGSRNIKMSSTECVESGRNFEVSIDESAHSVSADCFSLGKLELFSAADWSVDFESDERDSLVPCWSATSEQLNVDFSPPQRLPDSFPRGSYTLPCSAKMGLAHRKPVGLLAKVRHPDDCHSGIRTFVSHNLLNVRELSCSLGGNEADVYGEHPMSGGLHFPSAVECQNVGSVTRQVTIPITFGDVVEYKRVFIAALQGQSLWCLLRVSTVD